MKKLKILDKIETERLIIEMPKLEDAQEMYALLDEDITRFMMWDKGDNDKSSVENILGGIDKVKNKLSWEALIREKSSGIILGRCGVISYEDEIGSAELGYWIAKEYWGQGYIPEAVENLKKFAFNEMGWMRLVIRVTKENTNSRRVAEKCGFHLDGILRQDKIIKGKIVDTAVYSLLKGES